MKEDKKYIDFYVSNWALPEVLLALYNEGIKNINVTKQDNDLHIRLDVDYVRKILHKICDVPSTEKVTIGKDDMSE